MFHRAVWGGCLNVGVLSYNERAGLARLVSEVGPAIHSLIPLLDTGEKCWASPERVAFLACIAS